ncbi:Hypothetical predicted protein, partial [Olea europaea subsp. europaea]
VAPVRRTGHRGALSSREDRNRSVMKRHAHLFLCFFTLRRQRLIEEEKERLLKAQDPSLYQYLPGGTLKPSDLAKLPSSQTSSNMFRR